MFNFIIFDCSSRRSLLSLLSLCLEHLSTLKEIKSLDSEPFSSFTINSMPTPPAVEYNVFPVSTAVLTELRLTILGLESSSSQLN